MDPRNQARSTEGTVGGKLLTFTRGPIALSMLDDETRSAWDGLSGKATSGLNAGMELEQVPVTYAF